MTWCTNCGRRARAMEQHCGACGTKLLTGSADTTRPHVLRGAVDAGETVRVDRHAAHYIQVVRGPNAGSTWVIREGDTTVGRRDDCDILLDDVSVSRRHGVLHRVGDETTMEDAGSLNGTYLNGQRTEGRAHLRTGDILQIGRYHLLFVG